MKGIDWQNLFYKKLTMVQLYAICYTQETLYTWSNYMLYKETLDPKTQIDWKWKDEKQYSVQKVTKTELEVTALISDETKNIIYW